MKKRISLLTVLFVIITLCLSGCVQYVELSDRAIVQALGIDYLPDKKTYRISLQYFSQTSEGGQNQIDKTQANVLKSVGEGDSILLAAKNASIMTGKDLLLSENRIVIIGNELCNYNLEKTLEFFVANYHSHPMVRVVAAENTAEEIIDVKFKEGYVSSQHLISLVSNAYQETKTLDSLVYRIMTDLHSSTASAYIPIMKISEQKTDGTIPPEGGGSGGEGGKSEKGGEGGGANSNEQTEKTVILDGGLIFANYKAVGKADADAATGIQLLSDRAVEYSVTVEGEANQKYTITMFNVSTSINPVITDGVLSFDINISSTGRFDERGSIGETDTDAILSIEKAAEKKLENMLCNTIQLVKNEYGADIVGFEDALRHYCPDFLRENSDRIPELIRAAECRVKVSIDLFSLGLQSY